MQLAAGSYQKAIDALWTLEARLRLETHGKDRDLQDARALRDLAVTLGDRVAEVGLRAECGRLVSRADVLIDELVDPGGRLRRRVGELAVSFAWSQFLGFNCAPGSTLSAPPRSGTMWFASTWIGLGSLEGVPLPEQFVPIDAIHTVDVWGGKIAQSAGEAIAAWIAFGALTAVANAAMPEYRTEVLVWTHSRDSALFLIADQPPAKVRGAVAPLLASLGIPLRYGSLDLD